MLQDILNKSEISKETYGLSSDFAQVVSADNPNNLLSVRMMQRVGGGKADYEDVLFIGFQKPAVGKQGVILFVGKQKYPVFIPLLQNTSQKSGTVVIQAQEQTSIVSNTSTRVQYDSTYAYFNFNGGTPPEQRWVVPEVHDSLKLIARDWYHSSLNPTNKKLFLGDGSTQSGQGIRTSHSYGTQVDVYVAGDTSNIESVYSFEQIIELISIFKKHGVIKAYFDPADREKYRRVEPEFVRYAYKGGESGNTAHRNHFHIVY